MLRRGRLGALWLVGFASVIDMVACSSANSSGPEGAGGYVGGANGMIPIPGGGGAGTGLVSTGNGGSTQGGGGSGNAGNLPNRGGTGNTAIGGSGNALSTGGSMTMAGGTAGAVGTGGAAGMSTGEGTGGASGASNGGAGGAPVPMEKPPCMKDPKADVLIMGDSYVTGAFSPALQPALGALYPAANQFTNLAAAGVSMANGGISALAMIPTQFTGKPKLVIMDGGGNDILLCDQTKFSGCASKCNAPGSSSVQVCKDIVAQATAAAGALFDKMSAAGVHDVVYFFYPHPPTNMGGMKEIDDYSEPIARAQCEGYGAKTNGKTNCYWVSTVKPFADAGGDINPANFVADGIHPSQPGQDIIAREINNTLKAHCLAQPASSGCCM